MKDITPPSACLTRGPRVPKTWDAIVPRVEKVGFMASKLAFMLDMMGCACCLKPEKAVLILFIPSIMVWTVNTGKKSISLSAPLDVSPLKTSITPEKIVFRFFPAFAILLKVGSRLFMPDSKPAMTGSNTSKRPLPIGRRADKAERPIFFSRAPKLSCRAFPASFVFPFTSPIFPLMPPRAYIASASRSSHLVPYKATPILFALTWSFIPFSSPRTALETSLTVPFPFRNWLHTF
ncbi:hypothetical protein BSMD_004560 [Bacillus subtilis Miyagi-4]|nr:hypothetical protein BSMD_004560 [Bacillus subtilis Miyagi-4]